MDEIWLDPLKKHETEKANDMTVSAKSHHASDVYFSMSYLLTHMQHMRIYQEH